MSSNTEATASSDSSNNGNGKRERSCSPSEEVAGEARTSKLLRGSDDSDEKETSTSDGRSSTDPTIPEGVEIRTTTAEEEDPEALRNPGDDRGTKCVSEAMKEVAVVDSPTTESTAVDATAAEEAAAKEENLFESNDNDSNEVVDDDAPPKAEEVDQMFQIDRAGVAVPIQIEENNANANNPSAPPTAVAPAVDPRVSTATAAASAAASTTNMNTNTNTSSTSNPRDSTAEAPAFTAQQIMPTGLPMDPNVAATITNPEQPIEERGEVSALYVGRVIGKGGEMIRDLQARSGARIDVDQNVPAGQPRVITYRGTRETVDFAKQLVQMLSTEGVHENDLPLGHASQELLIIPAMAVGKVIGRGGEMIRELQSRSQAKIQIDHSGQSGIAMDQKQVTITGTNDSVLKAKEMVLFLVANPLMDAQQSLNMLFDDKIRCGTKWGSGPPYVNLPNQGINMQPHMVPAQFQVMSQGYSSGYQQAVPAQHHGGGGGGYPPVSQAPYGGAPMGGGALLPGGGGGGYPPHQAHHHHHAQQGYGGGGGGGPGYGMAVDGRETDVVYAAKQFMGRIIGGKGVTVNDLQRRSGCDIQINQDVPPGQECEITIKGPRQGIESAKAMIQEIIEVGPQHPYAGGTDAYGSGGGGPSVGVPSVGAGGSGGYHGAYNQYQAQYSYPQQQQHQQQHGYDQGGAYGQAAAYAPQGGYGQPAPQAGGGYGGGGGHAHHHAQQQQQQQPYGGGGYAPQQPVVQQQPPRQAPPPAVVSAWKAATAPDGQTYYYNERTGETQWEKPAGIP
jgi:rRNA processing protein Krr1/Pno1